MELRASSAAVTTHHSRSPFTTDVCGRGRLDAEDETDDCGNDRKGEDKRDEANANHGEEKRKDAISPYTQSRSPRRQVQLIDLCIVTKRATDKRCASGEETVLSKTLVKFVQNARTVLGFGHRTMQMVSRDPSRAFVSVHS